MEVISCGLESICPLHDLPVLGGSAVYLWAYLVEYISDSSRCKGKFRVASERPDQII